MKKYMLGGLFIVGLGASLSMFVSHLFAKPHDEKPSQEKIVSIEESPSVDVQKDIHSVSRAFGHLVGQQIESLNLPLSVDEVVLGIQESFKHIPSPMSEAQCVQAIAAMHEESMLKQAQHNLVSAEEFLAKNAMVPGVVSLEDGKLQYVQVKAGSGAEVVIGSSPSIRYTVKLLDDQVFAASQEEAETISLDDTIEGFRKGVLGMKEGEIRKIFIHPSLAYGDKTQGPFPPNSMLVFEVEVVSAQSVSPQDEPAKVAIQEEALDTSSAEQHQDIVESSEATVSH